MNAGQYQGIMAALDKILDRMPVRDIPDEPVPAPEIGYAEEYGYDPGPTVLNAQGWPVPAPVHEHRASCHGPAGELACVATPAPVRKDTGGQLGKAGERGAHRALVRMRAALDEWIQGARENHEACDHRGENTGDECWTRFHPQDIRNMINDVARELGLEEFPPPREPEENKR